MIVEPERIVSPPLSEINDLKTSLTEGEKNVLNFFLEHLEIEWEIYIQPYLNGLRPDFVLLNPTVGIAVFEVKDFDLKSVFYQNKKSPFRSPIDQSALYKQEISDLYLPRIRSRDSYACISSGVIFAHPDSNSLLIEKYCRDILRYDLKSRYNQYNPISSCEDLDNDNIDKVFPEHKRASSSYMNDEVAKDFRNWLYEPDFAVEQRKPIKLNSRQETVAYSRPTSGLRRVRGSAGSGKSIVLAQYYC